MVTPAPQDRWSQDKHIELVNIIGNPGARMLTRAMAKQLSATSTHECLFVDFLSEEEHKKVSEALKYPGWVDAMRDELNQFTRNKVWTLVSAPYDFKSNELPNHVCKLDKALYGVKQALRAWYLKGTPSLGLWYLRCSGFDLKGYSDSDYAGCNMDRSTSGACQLLGGKLVCWSAKKPDHVLKGDIELHFIPTQYQLANIFTKPLDEPTFKRLIVELGGVRGDIGGKTGGLDQISNKDATILYFLANGVKVDYAKIIWEDLIHKLNKKTREKIIPYPSFLSLILEHMILEHENEELTINPTQVFSVYNLTLKPYQPEEPPFTDHMKAICNLDVLVDSKAPKPSSQTEEVPQGKKLGAKSGLRRKRSSKHTSESTTKASKSQTG
ncbi:hypothetical protein Tco_1044142 [Tanacetum coccineum]|uniref:Retrovirus-related Pol polyprotein from transposon TNT 1-94 n=1 Tax=Tanacetum coccineum TaxID=301880 RepID=A0ABQ5GP30_9ASTR